MSIHIVFLTEIGSGLKSYQGMSLGNSEDVKICAKFLASTKINK